MKENNIPKHIAIIMDGNGRWAQARGLPRTMGHRQGVEAVKETVEAACDFGISYLTLFGFSSENWARPVDEINELMRLLRMYLRAETAELHRNNIKLQVIGDRSAFSQEIVDLISHAEELTAGNGRITVTIALNYGGQQEILQAASRWARMCADKGISPDMDAAEEYFSSFLMTGDMPAPDILIRTSGEQRISNFLLWQCAYSELFFIDTYWPDFNHSRLAAVLAEYKQRSRRFGGLSGEGGVPQAGRRNPGPQNRGSDD